LSPETSGCGMRPPRRTAGRQGREIDPLSLQPESTRRLDAWPPSLLSSVMTAWAQRLQLIPVARAGFS